ncbi:hypothetical protein EBT31_03200, partial [bacterium]|nr:hypothetical protein [bacterium]
WNDLFKYRMMEDNVWNSETYKIRANKNDLIVFPSKVHHEVEEYTGETPRITLSWNTFIKGRINEWGAERLAL